MDPPFARIPECRPAQSLDQPARSAAPRTAQFPPALARTYRNEAKLMAREYILHKVRTALGRSVGQPPAPIPELRLHPAEARIEDLAVQFGDNLELLAGKSYRAANPAEALDLTNQILNGRTAVASHAPVLSA